MPLIKSGSNQAISTNIREMMAAGHPQKQAVAAALSTARRYGRADGGEVSDESSPWEALPHTAEGIPKITVRPDRPFAAPEQTGYDTANQVPNFIGGLGSAAVGAIKDYFSPWAKDPEGKYYAEQPFPHEPGKVPEAIKSDPTRAYEMAEMASNLLPLPLKAGIALPMAKKIVGGMKLFEHLNPIETADFIKLTGSKGTMPGGVFKDPASGAEYYLKQATDLEQAKNEILAAKLYKLAGTPVADVDLTFRNGQPYIASRMIQGHQLSKEHPKSYPNIPALHENFPIDAWLGNLDTVGTGPENSLGNIIIDYAGLAHRIDTGGALRYKGTGTLKSFPLGHQVSELETMRDPTYSQLSANVFGSASDEEMRTGVERLANIDDKEIAKLVARYGPNNDQEKQKLVTTLLARKQDLMDQFQIGKPKDVAQSEPKIIAQPLKLMQLNKTHNLNQIIDTIKNYHWDDIPEKKITEKQKEKIGGLLNNVSEPKLNDILGSLDKQQVANVKSWLSDKAKSGLKAYSQISAAPSIGGLSGSNSITQVISSLKDNFVNSGNVSYSAQKIGKEAIDKFSPLEIWDAMYNLPLSQQQKILSWLTPSKKNSVNQLTISSFAANQGKTAEEKFYEQLAAYKPFDFREWESPFPKQHELEKPHTYISQEKANEIENLGFNPREVILHGGQKEYPTELKNPKEIKGWEPAFFASPKWYWAYKYAGHNPVNLKSYFARAPKTYEIDWPELTGDTFYSGTFMDKLINAGHKHNADLLIIKNMDDPVEGHAATQFAFLKTQALRAPHAKFNPANLHKSWPLAGLAGGSLFIPKEDKEGRASGGAIKYARGGHVASSGGLIKSAIPGRTDKIPMNVGNGSYIIPADIPSAIGQGNTDAGSQILSKLFKLGPYGSGVTGQIKSGQPFRPHWNWMRPPFRMPNQRHFADGGTDQEPEAQDGVPIVAAGGEMVVPPHRVREIGHGDLKAGFRVLDKFVLNTRRKHIETLKNLAPPKK